MNSETSASGSPSSVLIVHGSLPRVAKAGTRISATDTQLCLLTPAIGFRRSAAFIIAASVADLHASKYGHTHHDQGLFRFVRIARSRVARRIRESAEYALSVRSHKPRFRNAQLDAAEDCVCVKNSLVLCDL